MLVYGDDVVIAGSSSTAVDRLISSLSKSFPNKDLGTLEYFWGLQASYNSRGMILTQRIKDALDLLHRVRMENFRVTSTPLANTERLAHETGMALGIDRGFFLVSQYCREIAVLSAHSSRLVLCS
jgi:hypothetical protein